MVDGSQLPTSRGMLSEVTRRIVRTFRSMRTGIRELDFRSKPWMHKMFIATALIELIVMFFCTVYVLVLTPFDRYSSFMWLMAITGSIFLLYFACDAIVHENIVLIWVFNIGCLVLTARMWYIFVTEIRFEGGIESHYIEMAALAVATVCQVIFAFLSMPISEDFGRHIFFKVGARPHIVKLYKRLQIWIAILKLDVQSTMFMIVVASFYFSMSGLGIAISVLFLLVSVFISILSVAWAEAELFHKLLFFGLISLVQPTLSTVSLVNLNLSAKTELKEDIRRHHEQSSNPNATSIDMHFEAAMVVINSTVIICVVTRIAMLVSLYFVTKGFGKGLTQALTKQNDAAVVRQQSPMSEEALSDAVGEQPDDPEPWSFVDQCSHIDSIHLADKELVPEEEKVKMSSGDQYYRPISQVSQSSAEFARLRSSAPGTSYGASHSAPRRQVMEIPIHTATVHLGDT
eukprot:TRINITY_DN467_c3_g1_i1.p1 TRINITY_DN467_c3_g1~~TRINITY_DN467_c3_g1_i1.p1  ORF type:complete len:471 (+),score=78.38 TRINITY_DN467_c3_g1_i1:38-1414(+)